MDCVLNRIYLIRLAPGMRKFSSVESAAISSLNPSPSLSWLPLRLLCYDINKHQRVFYRRSVRFQLNTFVVIKSRRLKTVGHVLSLDDFCTSPRFLGDSPSLLSWVVSATFFRIKVGAGHGTLVKTCCHIHFYNAIEAMWHVIVILLYL